MYRRICLVTFISGLRLGSFHPPLLNLHRYWISNAQRVHIFISNCLLFRFFFFFIFSTVIFFPLYPVLTSGTGSTRISGNACASCNASCATYFVLENFWIRAQTPPCQLKKIRNNPPKVYRRFVIRLCTRLENIKKLETVFISCAPFCHRDIGSSLKLRSGKTERSCPGCVRVSGTYKRT